MHTLALFSQKGGSGKTTLAVHLAVAAAEAGLKVAIADTDPQQSATAWWEAREQRPPLVATITPGDLRRVVAAARTDGIDLLIVDSAPHAGPEAPQVARMADAVLIPCRPSMFDLAAVGAAVEIARAAGVPAALVLNECPSRAPEVAAARAALAAIGPPVAAVEIAERRAFARAVASGQAVTEFDPHGKAAEEIRALLAWVTTELLAEPRAQAQA
jgi:chromosome partitioning protein